MSFELLATEGSARRGRAFRDSVLGRGTTARRRLAADLAARPWPGARQVPVFTVRRGDTVRLTTLPESPEEEE